MDIWNVIERLKEAERLETDADLSRSILSKRPSKRGKPLSLGYFWNVRQGIHRLGPDVVDALAERALRHGVLASRAEFLEFKEACRKMPLREGAASAA
jgi:hypothetical protein